MKVDRGYIVAALVALALAIVVQMFPLEYGEDYEGYINYVINSDEILEERSEDIFTLLSNEPVWLIANRVLAEVFPEDADAVVRLVTFAVTFLLAFVVLTIAPEKWWYLLILMLLPQMFHNFTTHIRQGVAMVVFYAAYYYLGRHRGAPIMAVAPFIHSSMFFMFPLVYIRDLVRYFRMRTVQSLVFMFLAFLLLSFSAGMIAAYVGARQAENYGFGRFAGSGLGLLFWLGVGGLVYMEGKRFYWQNMPGVAALVFYYSSYLFLEISGRLLDAMLPLIFALLINLRGWRRAAFITAFIPMFFGSWYLQIKTDDFFHGVVTGDFWVE